MRIVDGPLPIEELRAMAREGFGDLVKAVVDVQRVVRIVDALLVP